MQPDRVGMRTHPEDAPSSPGHEIVIGEVPVTLRDLGRRSAGPLATRPLPEHMAAPTNQPASENIASRLLASIRIPAACRVERDHVVRARVRALSPVLAALTVAWIALDATVLHAADVMRI